MKEQDPDNVEIYEYFLKGALVDTKEAFVKVFDESIHKDNKTSSVLLSNTWSGLNNHFESGLYDFSSFFAHLSEGFDRKIFYALRFYRFMKPSSNDVDSLIEKC